RRRGSEAGEWRVDGDQGGHVALGAHPDGRLGKSAGGYVLRKKAAVSGKGRPRGALFHARDGAFIQSSPLCASISFCRRAAWSCTVCSTALAFSSACCCASSGRSPSPWSR